MARQQLFVVCCLLLAGAGLATQGSPVTKVVELIEELKAKIEQDGLNEQKLYNKYSCWCETTTKRKAEAIETAKEDIASLGQTVMEMKGKAASMASQIATLTKDMRKNEEAQQRATAIREKENTDFEQEKAEMQQAVGALGKAISTLDPASVSASLLKVSTADGATVTTRRMEIMNAASGVKGTINLLPESFSLPSEKLNLLDKFVKDPISYLEQKATLEAAATESYEPQATTIQTILKDMHDTFVAQMETLTKGEAEGQGGFEDLMATKAKELATMKSVLLSREAIKADSEQQYADASQELQNTEAQMKDDSAFFDTTKKSCEEKADEWEERSRLRTAELEGITKALEVLTGDDARALFGKSIKPGMETFLQVGSQDQSKAKALKALAKPHTKRLALIAETLRSTVGHDFSKIITKVEKMVKKLEDEEQEDIDQRDWCKETIFTMETDISRYAYKIEKTEAKITKLNEVKDTLENAIAETAAEILATEEEVSQMTDSRNADNAAFEQAKSDDEAAAELLGVAIGHLSKFYEDEGMEMGGMQQDADTIASQGGASLLQAKQGPTSESFKGADQAPDASFSAGDKSKGESKGIISILTMLKEDTEDEIKNGVKNEAAALKLFDEQKAAAEKLIESLNEKKTNLEGDVAETNTKIEGEESTRTDTHAEKDDQQNELNEIMPNCDYIIRNFEIRRDARKNEMAGLMDAIGMLSGSVGAGLVQKSESAFDDNAFAKSSFSGLSFLQKKA